MVLRYRKELVIKPEGTIPEYGGGLCQVSTTLYRAAIYGGLPIVDRAPHSYAVSYYSQVGGHGLDATIYPPSRDLKFKTTHQPLFLFNRIQTELQPTLNYMELVMIALWRWKVLSSPIEEVLPPRQFRSTIPI